ncbi:neuronal acetylcholine receptor subunit beta-2-like [Dreissena polymorpha]|uniref:Uncharacterized protein n=1 Tax=Dreissena polymorpha TaxID=45954 RepID=A0A9D4BI89_DREPO|nr:neuronal acetylcholine receptor subunit beta-2-like [Dreissena polymorpha]XP_052258405.1 neuronal acetylcholine receptor subunit beta-2-like [Dreissena polymorpha]KAH3694463.1 hypothetical protein DPMN_081903 [Dreissena polymorpha]
MAPIYFALATTLTVLMTSYRGLHAQMIADADRLLTNLMQDYKKTFRPVLNQSKPVFINTDLELVKIQDFDEVDEKISFTAILYLYWYDERLVWDPKGYGGISTLNIHLSQIWAPEMVQTNSVEKIYRLSEDWHAVRVNNSGFCLYYIGNVFSSSCEVDVTFYPFDKQKCEIDFMPAYYEPTKMVVLTFRKEALLTYYNENGAWDLVRTAARTKLDNRIVSFEIEIVRKPGFVIINMILPLLLMSVLNILVFLIPTECGERIAYCLTVLLSIAVILTLVGDNLPKNSSPMSLFSYYMLSLLVISVAITVAVICSLHVYHRSGKQPGTVWRAITRGLKCCTVRRSSDFLDSTKLESEEIRFMNVMPYPTYTRCGLIMDRPMYIYGGLSSDCPETTKRRRVETRDDETSSAFVEITWADVSVALDKIFFVFFVLTLVTVSVFFLLIIYNSTTL